MRIAEIVGWVPLMGVLFVLGVASMVETNGIMTMPEWAQLPVSLYRSIRDQILSTSMLRDVPANYADIAVSGVGLLTFISRKIVSFGISIIGFAVLAGIAWFVLTKIS